jgi:hypothetical protein
LREAVMAKKDTKKVRKADPKNLKKASGGANGDGAGVTYVPNRGGHG